MNKKINILASALALSSFSSLFAIAPLPSLRLHKAQSFQEFLNPKTQVVDPAHFNNWMNFSPEEGFEGMSVNKAYQNFKFKKKKTKTVIVAVIDSGVDVFHEEFKTAQEIKDNVKVGSRIWKNEKELNGTPGVDDDNNGYVDDFYGWNFAGRTDENGKAINYEKDTLEVTREYARYLKLIEEGAELSDEQIAYYEGAKKDYLKSSPIRLIEVSTKVAKNEASDEELAEYVKLVSEHPQMGANVAVPEMAERIVAFLEGSKHYYDLELKVERSDNPDDFSDTSYGNNDPKGPDSSHGTHVAGIIAGVRDNGNDMQGVATHVEIMSLRAVPGGDERDKDVSLAIRYAADNGAKIINMSFGKAYSPDKKEVDEAIKYAVSKGVLLFNAAGNSSYDLDQIYTYPNQFEGDDRNNSIAGMMTIGASAPSTTKLETEFKGRARVSESLTANFSNYGDEAVHIFAPGWQIYSSTPEGNYDRYNGTSMASPAAAGAAALVLSKTDLTNLELESAILENARTYEQTQVIRPGDTEKIEFSELSSSNGIVDVYQIFSALGVRLNKKGRKERRAKRRAARVASQK